MGRPPGRPLPACQPSVLLSTCWRPMGRPPGCPLPACRPSFLLSTCWHQGMALPKPTPLAAQGLRLIVAHKKTRNLCPARHIVAHQPAAPSRPALPCRRMQLPQQQAGAGEPGAARRWRQQAGSGGGASCQVQLLRGREAPVFVPRRTCSPAVQQAYQERVSGRADIPRLLPQCARLAQRDR